MGVSFTSRLLIALCLFGLYACQIEDQWMQSSCSTTFKKCGIAFRSLLEEELASIEPDIKRICTQAAELKRCSRRCISIDYDHSATPRMINKALEYVCDESRRDEVEKIVQDECFSNITIFSDIWNRFLQRVEKEKKNIRNIVMQNISWSTGFPLFPDVESAKCIFAKHFETWLNEEVKEMCGQKVIKFLSPIIHMFYRRVVITKFPKCLD